MKTAREQIDNALHNAGKYVNDKKARCPAHDDDNASLSISDRRDGAGIVVYCHAGCTTPDILTALGLSMRDLFDDDRAREIYSPRRDYHYPDGRVVHRQPNKQFPQSGNKTGNSLFHADRIGEATSVFVCEGEKDVEAIEFAGGVAVCSAMGASKAHLADWAPLRNRNVVVVADKDTPGRGHATKVAELLDGRARSVRIVEAAAGKDAADHIAAGNALDEFVDVASKAAPPVGEGADEGEEDARGKRSVAARLVDLARGDYTLGVTDTDDPFGVTHDRPHIALMLRGGRTGLRAELARRYFALTNTVASQQALADACCVLEGFAAQQPPQRVYLRVAEERGVVYIDMGDTVGRVIEISHGKWRVVDTAPVLFRRTKLTGELPDPRSGKLDDLWDFVGVDPEDRPLVLAVLVAALIQVDVPHVILALLAEQGSAKSTITRFLVSLVDPSAVPLRQPPRDPDGWTTAAAASWVVALDNLSGSLPGWLSDCLCRASTGDGSVKRALYTDHDVAVMAYRRCSIVNGVDLVVDRGDLAERIVAVDLRRVESRRPEDELAAAWVAARPTILGALLKLAAAVHYRLAAVKVADLPRMADFAKVLACVDDVLGTAGLQRYRERSQQAAGETLDAPFIAELVTAGTAFEAKTSAELLAALTPCDRDWKRPRDWPKNARALTGLLTRHAPALRAQGWCVEHDAARNHHNRVQWTIRPPEKVCNSDSQRSQDSSLQLAAETVRESAASYQSPASQADQVASNDNSSNSHKNMAATSTDELASLASQEYALSLDTSILRPLCSCGRPAPVNPDSGLCHWCAIKASKAAGAIND
jgi:5S rRNA maturation endonuclease (ribonuclease M5)